MQSNHPAAAPPALSIFFRSTLIGRPGRRARPDTYMYVVKKWFMLLVVVGGRLTCVCVFSFIDAVFFVLIVIVTFFLGRNVIGSMFLFVKLI